jgi:flagellar motor switch protein FliM
VKLLGFAVPFDECSNAPRGKRVRRARFEARSALPISAACVVANGVRETLASLLGRPVLIKLFEPSIPSPAAWQAILREARLYRVRGNVADAAVVLRATDATALAAALFGEPHTAAAADRTLSPFESDILDRMVNAIAGNLTAVCGPREGRPVERVATLDGFVTYFELLIEEPAAARIGIALSRDPSPEGRGSLNVGHLAAVGVTTRASLDLGRVQGAAVARLSVGAMVALEPAALHRCSLTAHGRRLAAGRCGVRNGRYAFQVDAREGM